jgi:RNA polymerase sigma factor for flagellar operon FliA
MATQPVLPGNSLRGRLPFPRLEVWPGRVRTQPSVPPGVRAGGAPHVRAEEKQTECDQLVLKLLPLVKRMALQVRERLPLHVEMDDLLSTGVLGLVDAVHKFDARKRVKLESYARYRIRGAILDGLRTLDRASRDMRKKNKKAETVYGALETKLCRAPGDEEMAAALGVNLEKWYRAVRELQTVGMDWLRPMGSVGTKESKPANEETLVADNQEHQFESCYRREQKEILRRTLGRIPERERQIVQLYYDQGLTMKEIGEKLGIDESRVSQLHSATLARLRLRVKEILRHPQPSAPRFAW